MIRPLLNLTIILIIFINGNIYSQQIKDLKWKQITKSHFTLGERIILTLEMTNSTKDTIKICNFYELVYSQTYKVIIQDLYYVMKGISKDELSTISEHGAKNKVDVYNPVKVYEESKECDAYYSNNLYYAIPPGGKMYFNINYGSPDQNQLSFPEIELPIGQYSIHTITSIKDRGYFEDSSFFIQVHERTSSQQLEFDEYTSSILKTNKDKSNYLEEYIITHPNGLFKDKAILKMLNFNAYALLAIDKYIEQVKDTAALHEALEDFVSKNINETQIPDKMKNRFSDKGDILIRGLQVLNKKSADRAINLAKYSLVNFPKHFNATQSNKLKRKDFYLDKKK